jgi:hypothetical protein
MLACKQAVQQSICFHLDISFIHFNKANEPDFHFCIFDKYAFSAFL